MKVGLVRNPKSGRGAVERKWPDWLDRIREALGDHELICEETIAPGSARQQAAEMADSGCEIVVAAGGDGTVCDVMQGLLGSRRDAILAVLPFGTGNDFARTIGVGPSPALAIQALRTRGRKSIDVGRWRQDDREGHFLNVAGCGFDAAVADRVNKGYRWLRGRSAYLAGVLQTLARYQASTLSLCVDGETIREKAMLCAFANAQSYGGGMKIAPIAELSDGMLDLVIVGELGWLEFLANFPKVLSGKHLSHPKVQTQRFRKLEVESSPPASFLVDGEMLPPGRLAVEVVPNAIEVIVGEGYR